MESANFPHNQVLTATLSLICFHSEFLIQPLELLRVFSPLILKKLLVNWLATQIPCCMGINSAIITPQVSALLLAAVICAHSHHYLFDPVSSTETVVPGPGNSIGHGHCPREASCPFHHSVENPLAKEAGRNAN